MPNEAGREQAAGEKVGSVQSPRSHLIYTSDGCRLRNPFAGSGGVGRFFLHKIMTESHLFVIVEKGTTEVVRGMEKRRIYKRCTGFSPSAEPGSQSLWHRELAGNPGKVQLGIRKTKHQFKGSIIAQFHGI